MTTQPLLRSLRAIVFAMVFLFPAIGLTQNVEIIPDVVYGHKDGMALTFDVAQPANPNGAAVMYMVSGGWYSRYSPPEQVVGRFQGLLDAGITLFIVRHGSAPKYFVPEAVEDVRRAAHFIQYNAENWGVDPARIGAFGGSAGGHLSLMLGIGSAEEDPQADEDFMRGGIHLASVVAYYPPADVRTWARGRMADPPEDQRFPALNFDRELAPGISPILFVSADDPPVLLVHGTADRTVPYGHSTMLKEAFDASGVESELITIEGAGHGFQGDDAVLATSAMVEWFVRTLE